MPTTLDPHRVSSVTYVVFLSPIYDTLMRRMPDGSIQPSIAKSWKLAADEMSFEMTLEPGRKFQDGQVLDAAAVKANIERAMAPESTTTAGTLKGVTKVEVVDPLTVHLELNRPGGDLPAVLSDFAGMMISPATFSDPKLGSHPIGSGPYKVLSFTDTAINYERWAEYSGVQNIKLAKLVLSGIADDTARLAAVRSGELEATFIRANQLAEAKSSGLGTAEGPRTQFYGLLLNTSRSEFGKPEVRQAIMHAIDREAINKSLYDNGCPSAIQPFPKQFFAFDSSLNEGQYGSYNVDMAKQLLAKAGLPNGFEFEMATPSITTYDSLGEVLQAQLAKVGITVKLKKLQSAQFTPTLRGGQVDAGVGPYDTARPDPTSFFTNYYLPTGPDNPGKLAINGVAELVNKARSGVDDASRAPAVRAVVKAVLDAGPPVIPVCIPTSIIAYRQGVKGFKVPLLGNFDFRDVSMTK